MFRRPYLLTKQLVAVTALGLVVSSVALADERSMNPFTGESFAYFNGGQNRRSPNMQPQSPRPQGAEAAGTRQQKDPQKIESKPPQANHERPITSPTGYAGADYGAMLSRLLLTVKSVGL